MAWIDPLDQVIYRSSVGRFINPISAALDQDSVFSGRVRFKHAEWTIVPWGTSIRERAERSKELIESHPIMGTLDVKNFYPTVTRAALVETIGPLPVHPTTFEFILDWLDELNEVSGIPGLPTGHQPSQILANAVLVPGDDMLSGRGVPWVRFVDDTWLFVESPDDVEALSKLYQERLSRMRLRLNTDKTRILYGAEALNEIQRLAISYLGDELKNPGPTGLKAGLELFEFALESPIELKSELRRAIGVLKGHRHRRPLDALRSDPELLRLAPRHWVEYFQSMLSSKPTKKIVDIDWLLEQITQEITKDDGYQNLLYLRAASRLRLDKRRGNQIFDLATSEGGWNAPNRVWGAHIWGQSGAFNPNLAMEQVETWGDFSTKRSFALTLHQKRRHKKMGSWLRRIRLADAELEATASWLEAA